MQTFSILTAGIFTLGYITARWDLVTRLYELAIFAWDHGVVVRVPQRTLTSGGREANIKAGPNCERCCHFISLLLSIYLTGRANSNQRVPSGRIATSVGS